MHKKKNKSHVKVLSEIFKMYTHFYRFWWTFLSSLTNEFHKNVFVSLKEINYNERNNQKPSFVLSFIDFI